MKNEPEEKRLIIVFSTKFFHSITYDIHKLSNLPSFSWYSAVSLSLSVNLNCNKWRKPHHQRRCLRRRKKARRQHSLQWLFTRPRSTRLFGWNLPALKTAARRRNASVATRPPTAHPVTIICGFTNRPAFFAPSSSTYCQLYARVTESLQHVRICLILWIAIIIGF